jgi:hypothetical protein
MKFPVNISPSSWSFVFFLLVTKYEISPKLTKNQFQPDFTYDEEFLLRTGIDSIKEKESGNEPEMSILQDSAL